MSLSLDCDTTPEVAEEPVELSIGTPSSIIRGCNDEVIVTAVSYTHLTLPTKRIV